MNRTTVFLSTAALLLLGAVVVGLPKVSANPSPSPVPQPAPVPQPLPPPPSPSAVVPGSLSMSGKLSHPFVALGTSDVFATLEVKAVDVPGAKRAPVNLAVVIDRSGSMAGAKIENARRAALKLVDLLDENDRLAVVHYGNDVRVFNGAFMTPTAKETMRRAIRSIVDEGGTNTGEGLLGGQTQLDIARTDFRVNRLVLLSDGQPTVGVTSLNGLSNIVGSIRSRGITVTALGIGADFNEDLMQRLADVGGGSYGFINNATETAQLFERDLQQAGTLVARNVNISVSLPPGVEFVEVYGRSASQSGRTVTVTLPDFSATQNEKLVMHLRVTPSVTSGALDIGSFGLGYYDVLSAHDANTQVALSAAITNDATLARVRRDKDALVVATKAQAAMNYEKAARAIDQGDYAAANSAISQNAVLFDDAEGVAGKEAMRAERQVNDTMFGLSTAAPAAAPESRRVTTKALKKQMLQSSGRGASTY